MSLSSAKGPRRSLVPELGALILVCSFALPAAGQFEHGDVLAGLTRSRFPETEPYVNVYTPSGTLKQQIPLPSHFGMKQLTFHQGMLFGLVGEIYVIAFDGTLTQTRFGGPFVFDAFGNIYTSSLGRIDKFNASRHHLNTWSSPDFTGGYIDLASDQCTIYYTSGRYMGAPYDRTI